MNRNPVLPIVLCLGLMVAPAMAQDAQDPPETAATEDQGTTFTEAGEGGAVLDDMVVEAENKVRQDVEKPGFEFELSAAVIDSFLTATDEEALAISPVSGLKPHLNNLERLASDQTPHYWLREMAHQPVVTFFPEGQKGRKMNSWQLVITDFRGSQFRTFEGGRKAPGKLRWDGRGDNGEMLKTGYPYSYVFTLTDEGTNTYNHAGVGFRIPALDYEHDDDRILEFSGSELFARSEVDLRTVGEDWLVHATDIMRRHPYSPLRVHVVAEDLSLAERRATVVAHFLADSMVLPREQVEVAFEQKPDLRSEMDGHVRVIIQHAD